MNAVLPSKSAREQFATARQQLEIEASDLIDLSWTPWRRIWLSARDNIWTLVDAADYDWLSEHVWNVWHSGSNRSCNWMKYAKRNDGPARSTVRMHREIMIRHDPRDDAFLAAHPVDHINGQTLDNRFSANLRWLTKQQNAINRRARGSAPSLDQIVRELVAGLGARPQALEDTF